ncbi:hypothetical protein CBB_A0210 [Clostridium botulinum Bf]|nr:hypothetical protein CBB_A0210 [Clostridium botulinum Bf]
MRILICNNIKEVIMKHFKRSIGKNNEFLKYLIDINKKG